MPILKKVKNAIRLTKRIAKANKALASQRFFYQSFCNRLAVDRKVVLIESFHGQNISDSGLEFAREIPRLYPGKYEIYFASENISEHIGFIRRISLDVRLIDVKTVKYAKILATAGYIFANTGLPIYFNKREGQVYLQTWHGTPLKTLGKQMRAGLETMFLGQHGFLQADYITQPNDYTRDIIMRDYNLENIYTGKVVMAGYPRNRVFMEPGASEREREEAGLQDKTVFVYMPTWRGTSARDKNIIEYGQTAEAIFTELDKELTDDQIIYVKFHPILRDSVKLGQYKHIKAFPADVDSYTFLNACDCLITDYSSVFFDFSLTKKPVILFIYDYEEYIRDRGITFDIQELPFVISRSTDELASVIRTGSWRENSYENTEYYRTFFKYDSYDVTERLLALVFEGENRGFEIIDYSMNRDRHYEVIRKKASSYAELNAIAHKATPDTIVWFYREWFNNTLRNNLYDYFNDAFAYVITTNSCPMTFPELFLKKLGVKTIAERIIRRDLQRTLPNLHIDRVTTDSVSALTVGCRVTAEEETDVKAESYACDSQGVLWIKAYDPMKRLTERTKKVYLGNNYEVLKIEKLSIDELRDGQLAYDFREIIENSGIQLLAGGYIGYHLAEEDNDKVYLFGDSPKEEGCINNGHVQIYIPGTTEYMTENGACQVRVIPYSDLNRKVCKIRVERASDPFSGISTRIKVYGIRCRGSRLILKIRAEGWKKEYIGDICLILRSKIEDRAIILDKTVRQLATGSYITATVKLKEEELREIYWDLAVTLNVNGNSILFKPFESRTVRYSFYAFNLQCKVGERLFFPYTTKGRRLAFAYRDKTEYDTQWTKVKEMTAYLIYLLAGKKLRNKKIRLVYEKFSASAQDNSYYFFKYCMDNPEVTDRDKFFYVIDRQSPDYRNVEKYKDNVARFMSLRHMLMGMTCRIAISTDAISHLYLWRTKPSLVFRIIRKNNNLLFLQHGVTALKRVDTYFGKKGSNPVKYFVTVSAKEQEIVVRNFGFETENVPITGFARWDAMEDKRNENDRFILVMPTWRSWLENVSAEVFTNSDYFQTYSRLLESERINRTLEDYQCRMLFYLHPKLAGHIDGFHSENDRISFVPYGQTPLNELIMSCSMLITDYSSVCWDTLFLDKPVLFYQFDHELYEKVHGSYIDMSTELPGERYFTEDELIEGISHALQSGMRLEGKYKAIADTFITNRDHKNCERVYAFLESVL